MFSSTAYDPEELEYVTCDYCGRDSSVHVLTKRSLALVRCTGCGLIYTNPRLSPRIRNRIYETDENYAEKYKKFYYPARVRTYRRLLKRVNDFRQTNQLLDIGCGLGFFLQEAKAQGWDGIGIEISEFEVNYAVHELGLNVRQGSLDTIDFEPCQFDVVTMWDVLEHLPRPSDAVAQTYTLLRKHGRLVIKVPDASILNYQTANPLTETFRSVFVKRFFPLHPEQHPYHFTPESLGKILEKQGFYIAEVIPPEALDEMAIVSTNWLKTILKKIAFHAAYSLRFPIEFTLIARRE